MSELARPARGNRLAVVLLDDPAPSRPDDLDTLVQAGVVEQALAAAGYRVRRVHLWPSVSEAVGELARLAPALVFNLVESFGGVAARLHLAAALVEALDLRLCGSGSAALAVSTDKLLAKQLLRGAGLATPDWCTAAPAPDGERWILKPVDEEASLGIGPENVGADTAALARLARERERRLGGRWFYERYVDGREFNVSLLEDGGRFEVLPIAEIRFDAFAPGAPRIVDYAAKWDPAAWSYEHTPRSFELAPGDADLARAIRATALDAAAALGLRGYVRVDLRVDACGRPWVLEANANPCLSPDAGFVAAARRAGLTMTDVVSRIVRGAGAPVPARQAA